MCPRSERRAVAACLLVAMLAAPTWPAYGAAAAQDELGEYLERVGASRLLAEHLERELASATAEERQRIVDRLAEVYPPLLEQASDQKERDELVRRASALLEKEGPRRGDQLRIALLRARYRASSRVAEDFRAALTGDIETKDAVGALQSVAEGAADLRARLEQRVRELERRSDRTGGLEGDRLVERTDQQRGMVQETLSLEAWSNYYRSLLQGDRSLAESSQALFARIIDTGDAFPSPKDVSVDLRSNEFFANSILGMALAKSRTESLGMALEWLKLLEHERTSESMRRQLPAWRIAIAVDRGEWAAAREMVRIVAADHSAPTAWFRVAAVGGLRAAADPSAQALAREAIALLASRRELGQIADLARRFGDAAVGDSGFAGLYVRGITAYERARELAAAGKAVEARAAYRDASQHLEAALKSPDASQFVSAIGSCRMLAGWSLFEREEHAAALAYFTDAASADPRDEESEWMALVCVEKLLAMEPDGPRRDEIVADLRSRMDGFLGRHPSSNRVRDVLVRRMALAEVPRLDDLERLLSIDNSSAGAAEAKRQAVLGLYRLFRETRGAERAAAGRRFLEAARELPALVADPLEGLPGGDPLVARQALEIALSADIADRATASSLLAAMESHIARGSIDPGTVAPELRMRRVQLELLQNDLAAALAQCSTLEEEAAAARADGGATGGTVGRLAEIARRHIFRFAASRLNDPQFAGTSGERLALARAAVRTGEVILADAVAELGSLEKALDHPPTEGVAATVTESIAAIVGSSTADPPDGQLVRRGLELGKAILARAPKDPAALESVGVIAVGASELDLAAECFRELVAGSAVGSVRWYRAKVALITVLATTDPERARAVLDQHVRLQPDYGPEPYGDRLRALEEELARTGGGGAPAGGPT